MKIAGSGSGAGSGAGSGPGFVSQRYGSPDPNQSKCHRSATLVQGLSVHRKGFDSSVNRHCFLKNIISLNVEN